MKKFITVFTIISMLSFYCTPINAIEIDKEIIMDNGDYIESIIVTDITLYSAGTKTATKTETYKNSSNQIQWSVSVRGTFSYNGAVSTCTNSTVSTTCPSSYWKLSNISASKSGNKAFGKATGKRYLNGAVVQSVARTVTLTCSPTGKLS